MVATAIIGGQWGDEGKGKVIDLLAQDASIVARFSGGNNAGHTVKFGDFSTTLHVLPCGIFNEAVTNIIGNGVVIDPNVLVSELDMVRQNGFSANTLISNRAHLIMPYHIELDNLEESFRGGNPLGTTKRGIGPAYIDKVARRGIRIGELLDIAKLSERLPDIVGFNNRIITEIYGGNPTNVDTVLQTVKLWADKLTPHIGSVEEVLSEALGAGRKIVLEGAQGTLLDLDHGTYPFVTSSNPTVGGCISGLGIPPTALTDILGVFKAYCTRVGRGAFPTEIHGAEGDELREKAGEYGATTGRPRRIGWFDGIAGRYGHLVNGFSGIVITRLDILDGLETIKVCTAYRLNGETIKTFPLDHALLDQCEPIYEELPGWDGSTAGATEFGQLPENAVKYIHRLEELIGAKVILISTGPKRDQSLFI